MLSDIMANLVHKHWRCCKISGLLSLIHEERQFSSHVMLWCICWCLDELYSAQFTDCTRSCLLLAFSAVHIQCCGKWLENWDGKTRGALGMMVREGKVCIQKSQLFYLQWSVLPFFCARVINVWINFWQTVRWLLHLSVGASSSWVLMFNLFFPPWKSLHCTNIGLFPGWGGRNGACFKS